MASLCSESSRSYLGRSVCVPVSRARPKGGATEGNFDHLLAIPARYVSGHLLGQGGTHAWVEVITAHAEHAVATAFDPCNGRAATARYLTVATGRDYSDIAPTSGTYHGPPGARLTTSRRLAVLHTV